MSTESVFMHFVCHFPPLLNKLFVLKWGNFVWKIVIFQDFTKVCFDFSIHFTNYYGNKKGNSNEFWASLETSHNTLKWYWCLKLNSMPLERKIVFYRQNSDFIVSDGSDRQDGLEIIFKMFLRNKTQSFRYLNWSGRLWPKNV